MPGNFHPCRGEFKKNSRAVQICFHPKCTKRGSKPKFASSFWLFPHPEIDDRAVGLIGIMGAHPGGNRRGLRAVNQQEIGIVRRQTSQIVLGQNLNGIASEGVAGQNVGVAVVVGCLGGQQNAVGFSFRQTVFHPHRFQPLPLGWILPPLENGLQRAGFR